MRMTDDRFSESADIRRHHDDLHAGSYGYSKAIGPDAGRLTLTYDDGDVCAANLYFSPRCTAGWIRLSRCTGSDYPADGYLDWREVGPLTMPMTMSPVDPVDRVDPAETSCTGRAMSFSDVATSGSWFIPDRTLSGGNVEVAVSGGNTSRSASTTMGSSKLGDYTRYTCQSRPAVVTVAEPGRSYRGHDSSNIDLRR